MYRTYQMARIIKVASLIYNEPRKWTRPRLAEQFEVNKATIQRDINLLREMEIDDRPTWKTGIRDDLGFFSPCP